MLTASVARAQVRSSTRSKSSVINASEEDAIRIHITQQVGQPLDPNAESADIKSNLQSGLFSDVSAHVVQQGGQNVLVYYVKERPQIPTSKLYGMKAIRTNDDKIVAAMKVHPGVILDPIAVKETINNITKVLRGRGLHRRQDKLQADPAARQHGIRRIRCGGGPKVQITKIEFIGNHAFSASLLQANMATRTYSKLLSWVTGWGAMDEKKLQEDVDRLTAFLLRQRLSQRADCAAAGIRSGEKSRS